MDLYEELRELLQSLHREQIRYALCGGLALAVYGIIRATEDIDLLVEERSLPRIREITQQMGFGWNATPLLLKEGAVIIHRLFKAKSQDLVVLDLLLVTPSTELARASRHQVATDFGPVQVCSPAGLILMKVDMSAGAVTRRLRRVAESVRICRGLAGPRCKLPPGSSRALHAERAKGR